MVCPCKGCKDRNVGCHSKCEGYSQWKGELKGIKKKRTKEADLHTYFNMPEHWKDHR